VNLQDLGNLVEIAAASELPKEASSAGTLGPKHTVSALRR